MAQFLLSSTKWGFKLCPQRESHSFMTVMRLWYRPFFPSELLWLVPICIFFSLKVCKPTNRVISVEMHYTVFNNQISIFTPKISVHNCFLCYFQSFDLMKLESRLYLKQTSTSFSLIDHTLCCPDAKPILTISHEVNIDFRKSNIELGHRKSDHAQVWLFFLE